MSSSNNSLSEEEFRAALQRKDFSQNDKLLVILLYAGGGPVSTAVIKQLAVDNGLRAPSKWNIGAVLAQRSGLAIRVRDGWTLIEAGKTYLATKGLLGTTSPTPITVSAASLQATTQKITSQDIKAFVEQAISCLNNQEFRAAVVLSWVGATALLYDHVVTHHLIAFNNAAAGRFKNWKPAQTADDLARMKEHDFLEILDQLSIIGKSVKQSLQQALQLRNGCGHPNSMKIGENIVAAHIELLILNVFSKF